VTLCTSHPSNEIVEAIIKAMSAFVFRTRHGGDGAGASGLRYRRRSAQRSGISSWHMFQARPGGGASSGGDGWSSIGEWHTVGGIKFGSIEVAEVRFPLALSSPRISCRSGGDGQFRGGLGVALDLVLETAKTSACEHGRDGVRYGPCGCSAAKTACRTIPLDLGGPRAAGVAHQGIGIEIRRNDCLRSPFVRRRRLGTAGAAIAAGPSARP